ncbi:MAG TPA: mucoidy inhibitor MuiA family protein [Trebonia sp.]
MTDTDERASANTPITGVTVFTDGARVTRTGLTTVQPGVRPVMVARLPESTDPSSVRVAVRGHDLTLLNVEVQRRVGTEPGRVSLAELRADVERCRDAVKELDDADEAERAGLGFLGHLSEAAAASLARALSSGRAGYDELAGMAGHLSASTATALGRRREIAARKRDAQRELNAAVERLAGAEQPGQPVIFTEVLVLLDAAAAATEAEIELTYHVTGASWQPLYDLILEGERLKVSYLAEITQETGEDWPEVTLVLSTTRQGLSTTLPELRPWYIGHPKPPRYKTAAMLKSAPGAPVPASSGPPPDGTVGGQAVRGVAFAAARPEARVLAAEPGHSESGAGLVYTVARPLAVPGDGGPHKTLVAQFEAEANLDYLTVPVLAPEAYLRATVTNGPLLLLPGQARIFHGPQFVGETQLDSVAPGEEFEVQLGVDDQIKVERKLRRRATSKAVLGSTRTIDIAYEITVENHGDRKATVSVHDHIPVATDGDIKVKPRETAPSPDSADDLGELIWTLTLPPGESSAIRHRFTVEHPAQAEVAGL